MIAEHVFRADAAPTNAYLVMLKKEPGYDPGGCDWEYVTLRGEGTLQGDGNASLCARCHAEAPHHCLFGLAR